MGTREKGYRVLFPLLLIVTFIYGKYEGGFVSWFLFYTVLLLSLYILAVVRFSLKNLKITRTFNRSRVTVGDEVEVEILIWNRSGFPHPYLIIEDDKPEKFEDVIYKNKRLAYPWFRAKTNIRYTILSTVRGKHNFKKIVLTTGDVFGLVKIRREIPVYSDIVVYPKNLPIINWHSRNSRNIGNNFPQNKISEDTASVIGVRDYRSGDRFNRIHWKHSAKTMHLMTKEFEKLITNDFMFILDKTDSHYNNSNHFETAVILAASLAKHSIDQHFLTGFVYQGTKNQVVPLSRGQEHLLQIFELLAIAEPIKEFPFKLTVLNVLSIVPRGTTLVLITSTLNKDLIELLIELSFRKIRVELFLVTLDNTSLNGDMQLTKELNVEIHVIPAATINTAKGGIGIG